MTQSVYEIASSAIRLLQNCDILHTRSLDDKLRFADFGKTGCYRRLRTYVIIPGWQSDEVVSVEYEKLPEIVGTSNNFEHRFENIIHLAKRNLNPNELLSLAGNEAIYRCRDFKNFNRRLRSTGNAGRDNVDCPWNVLPYNIDYPWDLRDDMERCLCELYFGLDQKHHPWVNVVMLRRATLRFATFDQLLAIAGKKSIYLCTGIQRFAKILSNAVNIKDDIVNITDMWFEPA